jgi:two-component system, LuxR family, sensor kinase FixL
MQRLKEFAAYLKEKKLEELAVLKLKHMRELNVPVLQRFTFLSEEEILQKLQSRASVLLDSMIEDNVSQFLNRNFSGWQVDDSYYSSKQISFTDIILINSAERSAFYELITSYTKNSKEAVSIMNGLEKYYGEAQKLAVTTLENVQEEQKRKHEETEEQYRDLFENASDLIHIVKPEGEIMYINNAWHKAIGYTSDELIGRSIYELISENEKERFRAYRERVVAGLPSMEKLTTILKNKNGKEVFVEGFLSCKFFDGKPLYTRGILHDITERTRAEQQIEFFAEQLVEREENFRQMIRNAPDAIIVIDSESKIKLWNPKAESMFGWTAMDVVGQSLTNTIIPHAYREAHLAGMKRYLETHESRLMNKTIELTALNKAGKEFYVSLTISQTKQAGETAFIAFIRDITDFKKNALELERKKDQLERSNKELEQFAWLASHDLKEPLRKIRTFSDILLRKKGELPTGMSSFLKKIQDSAARMNSLIEDLLSYSNASAEKENFLETDLNIILEDVLIDLEVAIKNKKAKIISDTLPSAEVLPFQMRQLFQNLVSNSIKYSKVDVPPVIEIRCSQLDDETIQIEIRDNGIGFDEDFSEKMFQIFQRLVPKEQYEGTGIGLALCKKIIENHNGTIKAEGAEGIGSTFKLILPLRQKTHQDLFKQESLNRELEGSSISSS